ncbi:hypothetical protein NOR_07594 [Metarhizium rileyi]|uniref:Oxidase ustYa n=1 Tax=Metarhizium rileyi (strain RCEF 4871) TaxID=1649241 RepID=A0A166XW50_METRR|nr:hypothetical protein NOR_07594 [Metarhizium rileyi RCEF 4871]
MRWLRFHKRRYSWLSSKEGDRIAENTSETEGGYDDSERGFQESNKYYGSKPSLFVSLLLNGSLVLLVTILWWRDRRLRSRNDGLLPTPVPIFPTEVRTFQLDPLFLSLPSEESNTAWQSLPGPNGMGFIRIDPSLHLELPDVKAGLSVFHQLHCLGALRNFMWELMYDRVDREALLATWPANASAPTYDQAINGMWHYAHCFDYLRQGIQCSGDTSLEFVHGATGKAVVDGLAYPHVCKNWDALWTYAKLHG